MENNNMVPEQGPADHKDNGKKSGIWGAYVRTAWLPGIGPRLKEVGQRFGHFVYMLAMIFAAVRLIQPNHPVLNPANIGKFGFRDVISAAYGNVSYDKGRLDQALIFWAVVLGTGILLFQFLGVLLLAAFEFMSSPVYAQTLGSIFTTPHPQEDLAFIGLEMIFGTQMFGAGTQDIGFIQPLHAMLAFFSYAMLIVAVFILIYFIFVVVGEAAISGTPFGRRFNGFYAPIRLVLAFGLLVPLANGLNTAQYITLYAAKMGSGMATNAWLTFAEAFTAPENTLMTPSSPSLIPLVKKVYDAEICMLAKSDGISESNKIIRPMVSYGEVVITGEGIGRKTVNQGSRTVFLENSPSIPREATGFTVSWSTEDTIGQPDRICGFHNFQIRRLDENFSAPESTKQAIVDFQFKSLEIIQEIRNRLYAIPAPDGACGDNILEAIVSDAVASNPCEHNQASYGTMDYDPSGDFRAIAEAIQNEYYSDIDEMMATLTNGEDSIPEALLRRGWGGAGLWYSQITIANGTTMKAAWSFSVNDTANAIIQRFKPNEAQTDEEQAIATVQQKSEQGFWGRAGSWISTPFRAAGSALRATGNAIKGAASAAKGAWDATTSYLGNFADHGLVGGAVGVVNDLFQKLKGAALKAFIAIFDSGLEETRYNYNPNPLVQLTWIGSNLLTKSMNFIEWMSLSLLATVAVAWIPGVGSVLEIVITFLSPIMIIGITVGLAAGIILYFIIPLMPFVYFTFALIGWLSEIFEAIVAMPLWALAHIRIDGDGIPGQAASQGYWLIFGIFTRPLFIVFGLIGGYVTFAAGAFIVHITYDQVLGGLHDPTSALNTVGFNIIYAVLLYNMAQTSFKMIDLVPANILRWAGSNAQGFNDNRQDPLGNLQQVAGAASGFLGNQLGQSLQGLQKPAAEASRGVVGGTVKAGAGLAAGAVGLGAKGINAASGGRIGNALRKVPVVGGRIGKKKGGGKTGGGSDKSGGGDES